MPDAPTPAPRAGLLHDERGGRSTARALLWLVVLVTLALLTADACSPAVAVPAAAYPLLTAVILALCSWAGGARIAQYLAPQVSAAAQAVGVAAVAALKRRDGALGIEATK